MSDLTLLIVSLAGIFLTALLLTVSVFVLYSGLLTDVRIRTGSPPVRGITVAYKYKQGPYKECGTLFAESRSVAPQLPTVGIFYDDPKKVPGQLCRCAVGSILSDGDERPSAELQEHYEDSGFQIFTFPEVTHAVSTSFPHRTRLSILLGVQRVYPQLANYIKERKLCAHPFLEIYRGQLIHYMSPLARQGDFYVPEVREAPRRPQKEEESEEDRRTDITGADSHSECSSISYLLPSDSRHPSLAPSDTPSTLYRKSWRDRDSPELSGSDQDSGRSYRSSTESSFEELDLETDRTAPETDQTPDDPTEDKITHQEQVKVVEGEE
ncbi:testis-expressed protein 264 [Pygocentrus nattereri]|uniref:Testis expressed 264, ER-phagy receptor a n=1 Tax=Pygocentrus nattereri TaxID=42514 RepID=A0A3B4CHL4_PYGNA|nr:testis-expressed protein 264 [Pygocentrus nattereri]